WEGVSQLAGGFGHHFELRFRWHGHSAPCIWRHRGGCSTQFQENGHGAPHRAPRPQRKNTARASRTRHTSSPPPTSSLRLSVSSSLSLFVSPSLPYPFVAPSLLVDPTPPQQ